MRLALGRPRHASPLMAVSALTFAVAAFSLPLKLNILVAIAAAVAATLVMTQAGKAMQAMRSGAPR